jgi:hypothetical protein
MRNTIMAHRIRRMIEITNEILREVDGLPLNIRSNYELHQPCAKLAVLRGWLLDATVSDVDVEHS